jgi:hypothetical protein
VLDSLLYVCVCTDGKSLREAAAAKGKSQPGDEMKNRRETAGLMLEIGRMLCAGYESARIAAYTQQNREPLATSDRRPCVYLCVW